MRLVDLFWLIAPEFHQHGIVVSWLDVVLPLSLGVDLARLLRLAAARPRDSAGARSAVRRSARPHHRARRAAEDGALDMAELHLPHAAHDADNPRSTTRRATSTSAAILGFGAGLIVVGDRRSICMVWLLFRTSPARGAARARRSIRSPSARRPRAAGAAAADRTRARTCATCARSEDELLTVYGWVDKNAGIVRIPIDEAMKLTLQRGLPARQERR